MDKNIILISLYDPWAFGICTLHSVLKEAEYNPISIFFKNTTATMTHKEPTEQETDLLKTFVIEHNPLFIAISLRSTNYQITKKITSELKKVVNCLIVWGGIHPTISPEKCIQDTDIVCIGEGEEALVELAYRLKNNRPFDDIKNLWAKRKINEARELIDLNKVPYADFTGNDKYLIDNNKITSLSGYESTKESYATMTTRGCLFACSFCCNYNLRKIYSGKGIYTRRRSVYNVINELITAKETFPNLKEIRFIDDIFTFDKEWIINFCSEYKMHVNLPFHCLCHPKYTDKDILKELKDAGLQSVIMGIQTGSEQFKKEHYNRIELNKDIVDTDALLSEFRIKKYYDIILNNPLETPYDKNETLQLLLKLKRPFELHTFNLTHFPRTKLTEKLLKEKFISENDVEDVKMNTWNGSFCSVLDVRNTDENLYWGSLYYLTQKEWMPKPLILFLALWEFYNKHPRLFTKFLKLTSFNIYSVGESKTDKIREKMILVYNNPKIIYEKLINIVIKKVK